MKKFLYNLFIKPFAGKKPADAKGIWINEEGLIYHVAKYGNFGPNCMPNQFCPFVRKFFLGVLFLTLIPMILSLLIFSSIAQVFWMVGSPLHDIFIILGTTVNAIIVSLTCMFALLSFEQTDMYKKYEKKKELKEYEKYKSGFKSKKSLLKRAKTKILESESYSFIKGLWEIIHHKICPSVDFYK